MCEGISPRIHLYPIMIASQSCPYVSSLPYKSLTTVHFKARFLLISSLTFEWAIYLYLGSDQNTVLSDLTLRVVAKFSTKMPQIKPKPSDIAAEAKRTYMAYIEQKMPQFPANSYLHAETKSLSIDSNKSQEKRLRVAVIDGDPVDVALGWSDSNVRTNEQEIQHSLGREAARIPLVSMANEKRAGGDWESSLMAPEECLCRRSNLVHALTTPWTASAQSWHYPIPTKGGIYSPHVGRLIFSTALVTARLI